MPSVRVDLLQPPPGSPITPRASTRPWPWPFHSKRTDLQDSLGWISVVYIPLGTLRLSQYGDHSPGPQNCRNTITESKMPAMMQELYSDASCTHMTISIKAVGGVGAASRIQRALDALGLAAVKCNDGPCRDHDSCISSALSESSKALRLSHKLRDFVNAWSLGKHKNLVLHHQLPRLHCPYAGPSGPSACS